jgi:hypothetical protein
VDLDGSRAPTFSFSYGEIEISSNNEIFGPYEILFEEGFPELSPLSIWSVNV